MEIKNAQKNAEKFNCLKCDYFTCKKSDFVRHQTTRKHSVSHDGNDLEIKNAQKRATSYFCKCGKCYKTYSGLWKHEKICQEKTSIIPYSPEINPELIISIIQQNKELQTLVIEQNKTIVELAKTDKITNVNSNNSINTVNSNNKTFNLNFFLNETCKNAMNLTDFMDSIQLQLSDLERVGNIGYVEGISEIIVKNLNSLDITQRPIHCTDKKRETLYVKDENKWEKEDLQNSNVRKLIKKVSRKNSLLMKTFREKNPDCVKSDSKYADQYNKLVIEAMGGKGENDTEKEDKIIKNISKVVSIEKNSGSTVL